MRKTVMIAVIAMVLLAFVVSPVTAGMFDRREALDKYNYRSVGGGSMGWLRTPDFKNPGFEMGNGAFWKTEPIGFNIWRPASDNDTITAHSGDYCGVWYFTGDTDMNIKQHVFLTGATGVTFWVASPVLDLGSAELYMRVYVGDDLLHEEQITTTFEYKQVTISDLAYVGVKEVRINLESVGETHGWNTVVFDDIHLTGPGF